MNKQHYRKCLVCGNYADAESTDDMNALGVAACTEHFEKVHIYASVSEWSPMEGGLILKHMGKHEHVLLKRDIKALKVGDPIMYCGDICKVRARWDGSSILLSRGDKVQLQLSSEDIPYCKACDHPKLQEAMFPQDGEE